MVKSGRISNQARAIILDELGKIAERRYKTNLRNAGIKGYMHFNYAFNYAPDIDAFDNEYWIDTGNDHLNRILKFLEYGTGLYGPNKTPISSKKISAKTGNPLLLKFKYKGRQLFKASVKGIKPAFMFTKAVESVRHERARLQRAIRVRLGI